MRVSYSLALMLMLALGVTVTAAQEEAQGDAPKVQGAVVLEPELPECPAHFLRDYRPVCASDGKLYANTSIFKYHQCRAEKLRGVALTLKDMDFCEERRREL